MAKYEQGQTVWGGSLKPDGSFLVGSAKVRRCGEQRVMLSERTPAFEYDLAVSLERVYPSEFDALMALSERATARIEEAEAAVKSEKKRKGAIVAAMAELAKRGGMSIG